MNDTASKYICTQKKTRKTSNIAIAAISMAILCAVFALIVVVIPAFSAGRSDGSSSVTKSPTDAALISENAEVRGVYIATVYNINYPSRVGLSARELRAELDDIIATCLDANLNAIYFQVRPSADALYRSDIFPASEYITGTQGEEAPNGFDVLGYLIDAAHAEGIAVHAWVNPLRVTAGSATAPKHDTSELAFTHPARINPEYAIPYADGNLYFDCGNPAVRTLIAAGVAEIASNYDVDGIIFDDYFYPYPVYGEDGSLTVFDDNESFKLYGGDTPLDDWRRDNVNRMIEECYNAIKNARVSCRFGVAPFGIWQNDNGSNGGSETSGFESYSAIYCDPTAWIKGGYIDYIAPQLYWRFTTSAARYDVLVRWWNTLLDGTDVDLLISHGVYKYDTWESPENELSCQVEFARSELAYKGSILYGYDALKKNSKGLLDEVREVFSEDITYSEILSNGRELIISIPYSGTTVDGEGAFVIGMSDPSEPLYIDGKAVGRTKSGYFSLYQPLSEGKNTFTFSHKGENKKYVINRALATDNSATEYATLNSPRIAAFTPSYEWIGSGTLPVTVTAPHGAIVSATLGKTTIILKPTLNLPQSSGYVKQIYSGFFTLHFEGDTIRDLGSVKFKSIYGGKVYTAESAKISVIGEQASIPIEVINSDTEMKVAYDSWYYDDYTPQSAGMRDNAVSLSSGYYRLRCGGLIASDNVRALEGSAIEIAKLDSAVLTSDGKYTYLRIRSTENIPINCYIEDGELCTTLYNVDISSIPTVDLGYTPLFTSVRGEKSPKADTYKYFFSLVNIENFYGFEHYYENGYVVVKFKNPEVLPKTATPLLGKTIVLDAGHGGSDPGALGPLGTAQGAMNESDFNLEIVMTAKEYLTELGAAVILIRDRETPSDIPVAERVQTLISTSPDLVISIHQNSMPYTSDITKVHGCLGLYWSDSGYMLTDVMGEAISTALNKLDRSPMKQRLAMVRNPKFPSTLIETSFMTCVEEYERMMKPDTVDTIARAISNGVLEYYEAQRKYIKRQNNS